MANEGGWLSVHGTISNPEAVLTVDVREASGVLTGHIGVQTGTWSAYTLKPLTLTTAKEADDSQQGQASGACLFNGKPATITVTASYTPAKASLVGAVVVDSETNAVLVTLEVQPMTSGGASLVAQQGAVPPAIL